MILSSRLLRISLAVVATAFLAGCAQPGAALLAWDSKSRPPQIDPLVVDGRCALVVSGSPNLHDKAIGHVGLTVEEGVAQIDVGLATPDAAGSPSFHVVVPIEELHVKVIFIGQPRHAIWEKAAGGKDCGR